MSGYGTNELRRLAADLGNVPRVGFDAAKEATEKAGEDLRNQWAANAAATAGEHGKHYPRSITAEPKVGLGSMGVEVGPDSSKPQGGMGPGFEFGSRNQPPHLDGTRATDQIEPQFADDLADAVAAAVARALT